MSIQTEASREIGRPVEEVFEYVTNVKNHDKWHASVTESIPEDGEMDVGSSWTLVYDLPWGRTEIVDKCTEYDPPNRFGYYTTNGIFGDRVRTTEAEYTFSQHDNSTRLTYSATTQVIGVARVLRPIFARMVKSEVDEQLTELKNLLEQPG